MERKTVSLKEVRQRKLLLILPVLTLPFITLLFWGFGGGKMAKANTVTQEKRGFNIDLPEPKFKMDSDLDKMSYYDQADLDSIKRQEQIKKDPNYAEEIFLDDPKPIGSEVGQEYNSSNNRRNALNTNSFKDPNEEKVYEKLKALQKAISQPPNPVENRQDLSEFEGQSTSLSRSSGDVTRLEQMMSEMNQPREPDPELKQLGGMLENILDIQHPSRVEERLKESSKNQKGKVFTVEKKKQEDIMTSLQTAIENKQTVLGSSGKQNSFYSLDTEYASGEMQNGLEAVIHETQTIVDGSTIKLRLSNDAFINEVIIPKNSFLYGIASLKGERLTVKIDNIRYGNSIFPVELNLYDMDGIAGIYIPGAINRDVAKASADRSVQTLGVASLDDSWTSQAAGLGIEAAKTLLSKKVKLIKVVVKAGYQVLLYDEKQKNLK